MSVFKVNLVLNVPNSESLKFIQIESLIVKVFYWDVVFEGYAPGVDVSGLVAGILGVIVSAVIAIVLGIYFCKGKFKAGWQSSQ